jgi:hypothetical protein
MATTYSKFSLMVTPSMIDSVVTDTTGRTTYTVTEAADGSAIVTVTMNRDIANSCGSNNGVRVLIKDAIPWRRLYVSFLSTGTASCWGWNGDNGYGTGLSGANGNLLAYSSAAGDFTRFESNVWNLPQFRKYFSACDNNSDNYMHGSYAIGASRGFDMYCRRNSMASLAGPSHGRTCSVDGTITFRNMRIIL